MRRVIEALDRRRQRVDLAGRVRGVDEVGEEQRVAAGSAGEHVELAAADAAGRRRRQRAGGVVVGRPTRRACSVVAPSAHAGTVVAADEQADQPVALADVARSTSVSSSADASSTHWASSMTTRVGRDDSTRSITAAVERRRRALRNSSASSSTSRVGATVAPNTVASSGSHGSSSGATAAIQRRSASPERRRLDVGVELAEAAEHRAHQRVRDAWTSTRRRRASSTARSSRRCAAARRGGATCRCPASPSSTSDRAAPGQAPSSAARSSTASSLLATDEREVVGRALGPCARRPRRPPTPRRATTRFFTRNGSSGCSSKRVSDQSSTAREATISPARRALHQPGAEVDGVADRR